MLVKLCTLVLVSFTVTVLTDDSCENWINHKNFDLVHSGGACGQVKIDDQVTSKIFNGETASPGSLPWMAYITTHSDDLKTYTMCGGSVINENYVLTAAHCRVQASTFSKVTLGLHDRGCAQHGCEPQSETYHVIKYTEHPDYDNKSSQNDIALLRLDRSVSFESPYINYICLPTSCELSNKNLFGEDLTMSGWGLIEMEQSATTLQKVVLPVAECMMYRSFDKSSDRIYPAVPSQLCTKDNRATTCGGDSGGPLVYDVAGRVVQAGLLSFGPENCTAEHGYRMSYFMRVSSFIPWILDNIEA